MNSTGRATVVNYNSIILVMLVFFIISFITNILNSILVDVQNSFDLSLTLTGLLAFSFFIAYGIMSIPAGFLSEKYGIKTLLGISFAIMSFSSFLFAFSPSYITFSITLFVLGCCMAVLQVIINPLLRVAGGKEHFAFNSVLAQLVFGVASFLSPFLYKYLVNDQFDNAPISMFFRSFVPEELPWVSIYITFGALSFVFLFYIYFSKYPKLQKTEEERSGSKASYLSLLKNKYTLLYFLGIFCYIGTEQGVGNWISKFLLNYHDLSPQNEGATTVSYFWAMLTIGCVLGLLLLKIMDSRKLLIFSTSFTILFLSLALLGSAQMALIFFPLVGFSISVMYSIIFSLGLNSVREHHGSLSGILCSGIAGGAIVPLVIGALGETMGIRYSMFFLLIPLAFICSIGFWAKPLVTNKTISF